MPLSHFSKVYAVKDCRLSSLTADPSGGSPTYASSVDVPGIKKVEISGNINIKELRGDNQLLDTDSVLTDIKVKIENAKVSTDVLNLLLGGTVTDTGTTPNQISSYDMLGTNSLGLFKLEAVSATADTVGGNVKFTIWKCKPSAFPTLGLAEEDYQIPALELMAAPLLSNGKWLSVAFYETAAVLS